MWGLNNVGPQRPPLFSNAGVCNLFHLGATFEHMNNGEGQSPSTMYKIINYNLCIVL